MPIPTYNNWKTATYKFFGRRNGAIGKIDDWLKAYHATNGAQRTRALRELRGAIENFKEEKRRKLGDYHASDRFGKTTPGGTNIDTLLTDVDAALNALPAPNDTALAMHVCGKLFDVKMADVDFSPAVARAAKAKRFGAKSAYDVVKQNWEAGEGQVDRDVGHGVMQSPYQEHEAIMTQTKLRAGGPFGGAGINMRGLNQIAAVVERTRFGVCESIVATVIARCDAAGMGCRKEWIGIPYTKKSGHSVAVFDRQGRIDDPTTWGPNVFIVDMWYFNLGMRPHYIYTGAARNAFIDAEMKPYGFNKLKVMADV